MVQTTISSTVKGVTGVHAIELNLWSGLIRFPEAGRGVASRARSTAANPQLSLPRRASKPTSSKNKLLARLITDTQTCRTTSHRRRAGTTGAQPSRGMIGSMQEQSGEDHARRVGRKLASRYAPAHAGRYARQLAGAIAVFRCIQAVDQVRSRGRSQDDVIQRRLQNDQ